MALDVREVNRRALDDPYGFVEECEAAYTKKINDAALKIADRVGKSCIVLLSGPSGSGKTTSAMKLQRGAGAVRRRHPADLHGQLL